MAALPISAWGTCSCGGTGSQLLLWGHQWGWHHPRVTALLCPAEPGWPWMSHRLICLWVHPSVGPVPFPGCCTCPRRGHLLMLFSPGQRCGFHLSENSGRSKTLSGGSLWAVSPPDRIKARGSALSAGCLIPWLGCSQIYPHGSRREMPSDLSSWTPWPEHLHCVCGELPRPPVSVLGGLNCPSNAALPPRRAGTWSQGMRR